ncbi:hypothetical protein LDO31_15270 [Luteimonas sp. XNQY3]|nr:YciI family protein [Luteimonas sp. XNQY3]MCD9007571.1 hypothetical protein [Luteimonas sp. XNQY3]
MKRFLVIAMRRPGFDASVIAPHQAFLDDLRARGLLDMTGGFADGTGGAYLLSGIGTLDEAQAIIAADPLVLQNASELVIHEWNTR